MAMPGNVPGQVSGRRAAGGLELVCGDKTAGVTAAVAAGTTAGALGPVSVVLLGNVPGQVSGRRAAGGLELVCADKAAGVTAAVAAGTAAGAREPVAAGTAAGTTEDLPWGRAGGIAEDLPWGRAGGIAEDLPWGRAAGTTEEVAGTMLVGAPTRVSAVASAGAEDVPAGPRGQAGQRGQEAAHARGCDVPEGLTVRPPVSGQCLGTPPLGEKKEAPAHGRPSLADALVLVAESFLTTGAAAGTGGERYQIFVHLEQDVLGPDGALAATLDDGTPVPAETLRRLACDAATVAVLGATDGSPLDVGRRARTVPPQLRRALWGRDRGCRFPGCGRRLFVHAHHIRHWAHGGNTSLDNTLLLCSAHHRLVHEGGFSVDRGEDAVPVFRDPGGRILHPAPTAPDVPDDVIEALVACHAAEGLALDAETNLPWWDGIDVPDYDRIVEVAGGWA
jgi:hypothetical protein